MQAFLEYLHNHNNDITVVYPNKWDIEQYVFDLESMYYKQSYGYLFNVFFQDG